MQTYSKEITFYVPCYNEKDNIKATIRTIVEAVQDLSLDYEILVFDDASTDNTKEVIKGIIRDNPQFPIRLICNPQNKGLGFNYYRGAFLAKGKYYKAVPGDDAEPVEAIKEVLKYRGRYDMVLPYFGSKENRPFSRKVISKAFGSLVNLISGNKINYYNGAVLHLTDNVRFWRAEATGYGYQAELICRLLHEGMSYIQVETPNLHRQMGSSDAFSFSNIISVADSLLHILWRRLEYKVFHLLKPGVTKME